MSRLEVPEGYELVGWHTGTVIVYDVLVMQFRQGDGPQLTIVVQSNQPDYEDAKGMVADELRRRSETHNLGESGEN